MRMMECGRHLKRQVRYNCCPSLVSLVAAGSTADCDSTRLSNKGEPEALAPGGWEPVVRLNAKTGR